MLGLTAIFQMLARAPMTFGVMVGLGAIGGIVLGFVLKAEQQFRRDQLGIVAELDRRGLYDDGRVRFVAPWEDPSRP
ncbi:hypothetical protein D3C85_1749970 [compost metagenome]